MSSKAISTPFWTHPGNPSLPWAACSMKKFLLLSSLNLQCWEWGQCFGEIIVLLQTTACCLAVSGTEVKLMPEQGEICTSDHINWFYPVEDGRALTAHRDISSPAASCHNKDFRQTFSVCLRFWVCIKLKKQTAAESKLLRFTGLLRKLWGLWLSYYFDTELYLQAASLKNSLKFAQEVTNVLIKPVWAWNQSINSRSICIFRSHINISNGFLIELSLFPLTSLRNRLFHILGRQLTKNKTPEVSTATVTRLHRGNACFCPVYTPDLLAARIFAHKGAHYMNAAWLS